MNIITPDPATFAAWNYQDSVNSVRSIFGGSYRQVSTELIEELYQAKLQLNQGPGNPHGRLSWSVYCSEAIPSRTVRTIDTWIKRHEIGEQAWNDLRALKSKVPPAPKDDDSLFIVKHIPNKDGTFTVRVSVSEYPKIIFEETLIA